MSMVKNCAMKCSWIFPCRAFNVYFLCTSVLSATSTPFTLLPMSSFPSSPLQVTPPTLW